MGLKENIIKGAEIYGVAETPLIHMDGGNPVMVDAKTINGIANNRSLPSMLKALVPGVYEVTTIKMYISEAQDRAMRFILLMVLNQVQAN